MAQGLPIIYILVKNYIYKIKRAVGFIRCTWLPSADAGLDLSGLYSASCVFICRVPFVPLARKSAAGVTSLACRPCAYLASLTFIERGYFLTGK